MSNRPENPSQSHPEQDPEYIVRLQVLKTASDLISMVEEKGPFQFSDWRATPQETTVEMMASKAVRGAVFEHNDLKYDWLDRAELSLSPDQTLDVTWTTMRPNPNTRTKTVTESRVSESESSHLITTEWSDVMPEGIGIDSIRSLERNMRQLHELAQLPPRLPKTSLWRRIFKRATEQE